MNLRIALIGLNHRTASVDIRERFALADFHSPQTWALPCGDNLSESLILSTCNRVELLGIGHDNLRSTLLERWASAARATPEQISPYIYCHLDKNAVRHIFEVASSLDSMVPGEPQILGQLKTAYRDAVSSNSAGAILNRLMHKSFSVAKRVRTETAIASAAVSISYAAVELAKRIFGDMAGHKALLLGAGEMAELAAMHLLQAGIDGILVINRTMERGKELAGRFHGRALPFSDLLGALKDADIIIASTGSKDPIVSAKEVAQALKARKNRPMFFIDIAVPRDIDANVNTLDNVYLYDIDDLKEVVEENLAGRRAEADKGRLIIEEEVIAFWEWLQNLDVQPTILDLIAKGENAANEEVAKTLKRLGNATPETREALEIMAASLVRKINHAPIMFLKDNEATWENPRDRIEMVRKIFNLDHDNSHCRSS